MVFAGNTKSYVYGSFRFGIEEIKMATQLIRSWFKPAAKTTAAIDVHDKIAALDSLKYSYDLKMRDLRAAFETEANRLHEEYLDGVLRVHAEE